MNKSHLNKLIDTFQSSQDKKDKSYYSFFRNVSTLNIALIGLLIGLQPQTLPSQMTKYLFLLSVSLIGLCILSSLGVQYGEVSSLKQAAKIRYKQILEYTQNPDESNSSPDIADKNKLESFFEKMTFVCLTLSIVSLILYVYFSLEIN